MLSATNKHSKIVNSEGMVTYGCPLARESDWYLFSYVSETNKCPLCGDLLEDEMSRFNYIQYDQQSMTLQQELKVLFEAIEEKCGMLSEGRAKSLILTHLEESYMWTGKAIRDAQLLRNDSSKDLPQRSNE